MATLIEIKRSYKRLARKYHPDINPGDHAAEARFKEITRAYETLSDPERRLRYDAGALAGVSSAVSFEFEGFDFSAATSHADTTFGDLFAEIFTQRQDSRRIQPERGADLHAGVVLSFDEAMKGAAAAVHPDAPRDVSRLSRHGRAERCRGPLSAMSRAPASSVRAAAAWCSRRTATRAAASDGSRRPTAAPVRVSASRCAVKPSPFAFLPALGTVRAIRVPEKGNAGQRGGRLGDLYITVHVEPHEAFRRDGDDLHTVVAIGVHEAALGAKIDVPAPDGPARLRVPPGTQTGQRFRVRGRGAPSPRDGERGDLGCRSEDHAAEDARRAFERAAQGIWPYQR